jgi:ABC-type transport system involved in multi-copper enzyme maturation permease subunit
MRVLAALVGHTLRECFRRPFPYVATGVIMLIALASLLLQAFSFGAAALERTNLALSSVFLGGLVHAALVGTQLVRDDLERGTLGLALTKPVSLLQYIVGRFLGLALSSLLACAAIAACVTALLSLPLPGSDGANAVNAALYSGWARAMLPVFLLDAVAIAASAAVPRFFAPLALAGVFLAGSVAPRGVLGAVLPDFSLFGLQAGASPAWTLLLPYGLLFCAGFVGIAYIVLASRIRG